MLYVNSQLKAAKEIKGGRLLAAEVATVRERAMAQFAAMDDEQRALHVSRFRSWQEEVAPQAAEAKPKQYKAHWGGGCRRTIISPEEFCDHCTKHGWPKDAEVYHGQEHHALSDASQMGFGDASDFNLWGCWRKPSNVCRLSLGGRLEKFEDVHTSLQNWIALLGPNAADTGSHLCIVQGLTLSEQGGIRTKRFAMLLTGTCYSPRVADFAVLHFQGQSAEAEVLNLPCDLILGDTMCTITKARPVINFITSAELVESLVCQHQFTELKLFDADYTVLELDSGALDTLRLEGLSLVGDLFIQGSRGPGIRQPPKPRARRLRVGDPLNPAPRDIQRGRGQGRPRGRAGRGRAGGRGRLADLADPSDDPAAEELPHADAEPSVPARIMFDDCIDNSASEDVVGSDGLSDGAIDELNYLDEEAVQANTGGVSPFRSAEMSAGVAEESVSTGLAEASVVRNVDVSRGSSVEEASTPEDLVIYPSGRVYDSIAKRHVATIWRGKPANTLALRCYRRSKYTWVLPQWQDPGDEEIKRWILAVPRSKLHDSAEQRRAASKAHIELAKRYRNIAPVFPAA